MIGKCRIVKLFALVFIALWAVQPAAEACFRCPDNDQCCEGRCPPKMICKLNTTIRACTCEVISDIDPRPPWEMAPFPSAAGISPARVDFAATLVGSEGGSAWLTPGNSLLFTQEQAVTVTWRHSQNWCSGCTQTLTIPSRTLNVVVRLEGWDTQNPNRLLFRLTSLSANLPSFPSLALNGGATGDNIFSLLPNESGGYVDVVSGEVSGNVYVRLRNNIFTGDQARIQGTIWGTYNAATGRLTLKFDEIEGPAVIATSDRERRVF